MSAQSWTPAQQKMVADTMTLINAALSEIAEWVASQPRQSIPKSLKLCIATTVDTLTEIADDFDDQHGEEVS